MPVKSDDNKSNSGNESDDATSKILFHYLLEMCDFVLSDISFVPLFADFKNFRSVRFSNLSEVRQLSGNHFNLLQLHLITC